MTRIVSTIELPYALHGDEPVGIYKDMSALRDLYRKSPGLVVMSDAGVDSHLFGNERSCVVSYDKRQDGRELEGFAQYLINARYDIAHVDNLYVHPSKRQRGVGKAIINAIAKEAKQKGVHRIDLLATRDATGFYEKLGFEIDSDKETAEDDLQWMNLDVNRQE